MSEFAAVSTVAEMKTLDKNETMSSYWHGMGNGAAPGSDKGRAFHHGWRNGLVDGGFAEADEAQRQLSCEVIGLQITGQFDVLH